MEMMNQAGWVRKAAAAFVLLGAASLAQADNAFTQPDGAFTGNVRLSQPQPVYAGTQAAVAGSNFKPGQQITLERGRTVLNAQPYVADAEGKFSGSIAIPQNAVVGMQPVVVKVSGPDAALVFNLKVSPQVALSGQNLFEIEKTQPASGLYQSAYSEANKALFVTASVGRPPVRDAHILRLNPQTLAIEASVVPDEADERSGLYAVYGIAVDDKHGTVWVTNTRQGTVTVYSQKDLSLIKRFENGSIPAGRDVVIDAANNKAYISSPGSGNIYVADTDKLELIGEIAVSSKVPRGSFKPMSLSLDAAAHKLYTVSMGTAEAAVINTTTGTVEQVYAIPGLAGGAGVSINSKDNQLLVTGQNSDGVFIVDTQTGNVLHQVATGAGALNVVYNPHDGLAYVANRGAGTVTAVNSKGQVVANLDIGPNVNHISVDKQGNLYVANKAQGENNPRNDQLTRVTPVK